MKNDRLFESLSIAELMVRKKANRLISEEEQSLKDWADLSEENSKLYKEIEEGKGLGNELDKLNKYNAANAFAAFQSKVAQQQALAANEQGSPQLYKSYRFLIGIAASLFILAGLGYYFYEKDSAPVLTADSAVEHLSPGSNRAVLTLANGKEIQLSSAKNGVLAVEGEVKVNKTKDGELVYSASANSTPLFHKIQTPRGGMYQINLPDGTKVWLNAATSLKYPVSFNGLNERKVALNGEAYFEIAKQKTPFIVSMKGLSTEVLGTHFNINNYPDEAVIRTTLLEGSIKVSIPESTYSKVLKPGYEAIVGAAVKGIELEKVDVNEVIAWRNGSFVFKEQDLGTIMREVSRWYNVEVEFADPEKRNVEIGGSISRYSDVKKVLRMLELTGLAKFKLVGNKVIVQ